MADRIRDLHAQADALLSRLAARALEEEAAAAYPSAGDLNVSSSMGTSSTEQAGTRDLTVVQTDDGPKVDRMRRAGEWQAIERGFSQAVSLLQRLEDRLTPQVTGDQCPTATRDEEAGEIVRCTGQVTHRGRCEQCDRDWRPRRGVAIPPDVIRARNRRRTAMCACTSTHDHEPGVCVRTLEPGVTEGMCGTCRRWGRCQCGPDCCPDGCTDEPAEGRTMSERCRKRQQRNRRGEHPWSWQKPR